MRDYGRFGYKPDYGYKIFLQNKLIASSNVVKYAVCFSEVFSFFGRKEYQSYYAEYTLRCRKQFVEQSGNYCSLVKPQIYKILRYMRTAFKMQVTLTEDPDNYIFLFKVEGMPIKHKWILTFSRVFFEFPYNEMARDVLYLRDKGIVKGINYTHKSFLELFHLIYFTCTKGSEHSLWLYPNAEVPIKHLQQTFTTATKRVHSVYGGEWEYYGKLSHFRSYTGLDWDEDFDTRSIKYSKNYKILKRLRQHEKDIRRRKRD